MASPCATTRAVLALTGLMLGGAWAAAGAATTVAAVAPVSAEQHRQAAQQQSRGNPALKQVFLRACAKSAAPSDASLAEQALRQAEAEHQRERAQARPDAERLLQVVVRRGCAAYHATRLQAGVSYPVWLHTGLVIEAIRPAANGLDVQARASSANGRVSSSRVTFSRGLHHACFVATDAAGLSSCVMVDTHPHGDRINGWAETHEGPVIAAFAGSVSPGRVELPAVAFRDMPVFVSLPSWTVGAMR